MIRTRDPYPTFASTLLQARNYGLEASHLKSVVAQLESEGIPKELEEVIGKGQMVADLKNRILNNDRFHHMAQSTLLRRYPVSLKSYGYALRLFKRGRANAMPVVRNGTDAAEEVQPASGLL